jgi:hypothetical protein
MKFNTLALIHKLLEEELDTARAAYSDLADLLRAQDPDMVGAAPETAEKTAAAFEVWTSARDALDDFLAHDFS